MVLNTARSGASPAVLQAAKGLANPLSPHTPIPPTVVPSGKLFPTPAENVCTGETAVVDPAVTNMMPPLHCFPPVIVFSALKSAAVSPSPPAVDPLGTDAFVTHIVSTWLPSETAVLPSPNV